MAAAVTTCSFCLPQLALRGRLAAYPFYRTQEKDCCSVNKLKLMTVIGTRPEIIRLSAVIKTCDKYFDQILVHTGQNYD